METQLTTDTIFSFDPREVDLPFLRSTGIVDLVARGYRFVDSETDQAKIEEYVLAEFKEPFHDPVALYSHLNGRVGSLLILDRLPDNLLEIAGIFIAKSHPDRGPGGAADKLLRYAVESSKPKPKQVVGFTNNIRAMMLRSRVLYPLGYSTKVGSIVLSGVWTNEYEEHSKTIIEKYTPHHNARPKSKNFHVVDGEYLEKANEQMDGDFPSPYPQIHETIMQMQASEPDDTVCMLLLSMAV